MHLGIDYGSNIAGTTVISYLQDGVIHQVTSVKKKSADLFISSWIDRLTPNIVCIDAPLSLPAAYYGKGQDFFYRKCDKETKAMSPMFLGGLTARAMKLAASHSEIPFIEVYPGGHVRNNDDLIPLYRKKDKLAIKQFVDYFTVLHGINLAKAPHTWHEVDSLLAWHIGNNYLAGNVEKIGDEDEGIIHY